MKNCCLLIALLPLLMLVQVDTAGAEARREGGEDVLRKAQYMIRQLNQENVELQKQVAELQAKADELGKRQQAQDVHLAKSRRSNQQLIARLQSDSQKFRTLLERYRETVKTLRQSSADNQYLVKAVEEREQWIAECRDRNQGLFAANSDLLARYKKAATRFSEPITGISTVTVENEAQDYRFKLEDLQVTKFSPEVDVASHTRRLQEIVDGNEAVPGIN